MTPKKLKRWRFPHAPVWGGVPVSN